MYIGSIDITIAILIFKAHYQSYGLHQGGVASMEVTVDFFNQELSMERIMKIKVVAIIVSSLIFIPTSVLADCIGYTGPGGPCSTGPGGGLSTGPGGGLSTGPGGGLSTGPGGGLSTGPGGGLSTGPGNHWRRSVPAQ